MALDLKTRRTTYNSSKSIHGRGVVKKRLVTTTVIILSVGLLLVGAAIVYTWYQGQQPVIADETPTPRKKLPLATPQKIDDTVKVGVSMQSFTDTVEVGKNASLIIKTNPAVACSIRVEYNKQASTDSGLVPKKADDYGVVSWTWTVETSRPVGKWPVSVTCANAKNSAVLALDLRVVPME